MHWCLLLTCTLQQPLAPCCENSGWALKETGSKDYLRPPLNKNQRERQNKIQAQRERDRPKEGESKTEKEKRNPLKMGVESLEANVLFEEPQGEGQRSRVRLRGYQRLFRVNYNCPSR